MAMNQQGHSQHRRSVPSALYPQHDQTSSQTQQRAQSVSQSSFQPFVGTYANGGWRDGQGRIPGSSDTVWSQPLIQRQQPQQRQHLQQPQQQQSHSQQYISTEGARQQAFDISNFNLSEIQGVINSPNDAPWSVHGSQQHVPHLFNSEQFQTSASGAMTAIPDTRSHQGKDSAYYSQSSHKRSAPSEEMPQQISDELLSPMTMGPRSFFGNSSPRSVVSDTQIHKRTKRSSAPLQCPREGCTKVGLKNQSDLNKHMKQHDRPFICKEPNCDRREGFGTSNDLERHRASVHGLQQRCGSTVGFICKACEQADGSRKWWPRKDNYRSHIKRRHEGVDETLLIQMSSYAERPADAHTEIRSATSHHGNDEDRLQRDFPWPQTQSFQSDVPLSSPGDEGEILAGVGHLTSGDSAAGHLAPDGLHMPQISLPSQQHARVATSNASFDTSFTEPMGPPTDFAVPTLRVKGPVGTIHSSGLDSLGYGQPARGSRSVASTSQAASHSKGGYPCRFCIKVKKRPCDLRKHEKRHDRPYGCTFPRCFRKFGSRSDWKRHESAQHFLDEQWRCQVIERDGSRCGRLFSKQTEMADHLNDRHGHDGYNYESPLHATTMESSHLGREGHLHFWCGFCNDLVDHLENVPSQGNQDPRFQHIGDHFDKDKKYIDDWVDIEENKQKRFLAPPPKTSGKQAQAARDSSPDESDLGDDGIPEESEVGSGFVAAGYTGPVDNSAGYGVELPVRGNLYAGNQRGQMDEADAEGEVDDEYPLRYHWE